MLKLFHFRVSLSLLFFASLIPSYSFGLVDFSEASMQDTDNPVVDKVDLVETLSSVWNGISHLLKKGLESVPQQEDKNEVIIIDKTIGSGGVVDSDSFVDISDSKYQYEINVLRENNVVGGGNKFYPQNMLRFYEFMKIVVQAQRVKKGIDLDTNVGITTSVYLTQEGFDKELLSYINTAYENGFLEGIDKDSIVFDNVVEGKLLSKVLYNIGKQYPTLVDLDYLNSLKFGENSVKKGELASYVVRLFQLKDSDKDDDGDNFFKDTAYNTNGAAVERLRNLGILDSSDNMFNINNNITRIDFLVMLVNSQLLSDNKKLQYNPLSSQDFADITDKGSLPYVSYAKETGMINYLIETKRGSLYFYPTRTITKNEAYHVITDSTNSMIDYNEADSDKQILTRGEAANLIYNIFKFGESSFDNKLIDTSYDNADDNSLSSSSQDLISSISSNQDLLVKIKTFFASL